MDRTRQCGCRLPIFILFSTLSLLCVARSQASEGPRHWAFEKSAADIEFYSGTLSRNVPPEVARSRAVGGDAWYGRILRRLPGEGRMGRQEVATFQVVYRHGRAAELWCDTDGDGDLTHENPVSLESAGDDDMARSCRVTLRWSHGTGDADPGGPREVRIRLGPWSGPAAPPSYRLAWTEVMAGTVVVSGKPHRAILFDGDGEGHYSIEAFDGVIIDLDDDGRFEIDPMSPGFCPFSVPFDLGGRRFRVVSVARDGRFVLFEDLGTSPRPRALEVGRSAPDFGFTDHRTGRAVRLDDYAGRPVLIVFGASWSEEARARIPSLRSLQRRRADIGLEILAVSYDTSRVDLDSWLRAEPRSWPVGFSGRMYWENEIGRLYRAGSVRAMYLVDRHGRLDGVFTELADVESRLELMADAAPEVR